MLGSITASVVLDVWSDVACPWCYIGLRHLDAALEHERDGDVEVRWHAYELQPDLPADGHPDPAAFYARKFGGVEGQKLAHARVAEAGRAAGIDFAFPLRHAPNTRRAHNLVAAARAVGRERDAKLALFRAHFEEGRDVADVDTLLELARRAVLPLDHAELAGWLRDGAFDDAVVADEAAARRIGVTGVPFFVANRAVATSGAQPPTALSQLLDLAREHPVPGLDG